MAGHAYKSAVDELDVGVGRDLVSSLYAHHASPELMPGRTFPSYRSRTSWKDEQLLRYHQYCYHET